MRYTLRQLEVFLATARHENISRAADELAMSQSAASGALKALEAQFDVQLFDRVGKQLRLNPLGASLRPTAQQLLDRADDLEATLSGDALPAAVNFGATLTIGNYLALRMVAAFRRACPHASLRLEIANTQDIVRRVAAFDLDMGLIEGEVQHPDLSIEHWRRDELVVFAAPDHPLASRRRIDDKALASLPWIVREQGSGTRQAFDRAMHGILPDLTIEMELTQPKAIKHAVELGLGVGCLSRISVEESFARGTLVPLNVPQRAFTREWFIITHKDKYRTATLQQWLDHCKQTWSNME